MADAFDTLGLAPTFDLAEEAVQREYLARVAACHPDLASADPERAADAARRSAQLNDARQTLLDPERRARALLARLGETTGDPRELPDGFLAQIMETRMLLEDAAGAGDAAEIAKWRAWADQERAGYIRRIAGLFAQAGARPTPAAVGEVRRHLNAWRYIERLIEQLPHDG